MKKKKQSLKELKRTVNSIENILGKYLYPDLEEMLFKANYRLLVLEDALKSRAADQMTKGEIDSWWEKYLGYDYSSPFDLEQYSTKLLSGYLDYDKEAIEEYLDIQMVKVYNVANEYFEKVQVREYRIIEDRKWYKKKPSKRDLERAVQALNKKVDFIVSFFCDELSVTLVSIEVLENVIEGYIKGEVPIGQLKLWAKKWDNSKRKQFESREDLLRYLGLENLSQAKKKLVDLAFSEISINTKLIFSKLQKVAA